MDQDFAAMMAGPARTVLQGGTAQYAFLTPDRAQVLAACVTAAAREARGEHPAHVADHAWIMFSRLVDHAAGRAG